MKRILITFLKLYKLAISPFLPPACGYTPTCSEYAMDAMEKHGAIKELPRSISRKTYLEIEGRMREFSRKTKIPIEELDLLFWSAETGFVFK